MNGRLHIDVRGMWDRRKLDAFSDADCFALPSQTENFGNAAAEAAAIGLPVVVSDACGVAEVLDPSAHRVIGVGDVDALAAAIGDSPGRAEARRASAAPALRALLDWSSIVEVQLESTGRSSQARRGLARRPRRCISWGLESASAGGAYGRAQEPIHRGRLQGEAWHAPLNAYRLLSDIE